METIINNEDALPKIVKFLRKYFDNVKVIKNKNSHLANHTQNFYTIILFENRGEKFYIKWNYGHCRLYFGDITKNNTICFEYTFTKIKLDNCYPIEEMNNWNVVFWMYEIINPFDYMSTEISPLRFPVTPRS